MNDAIPFDFTRNLAISKDALLVMENMLLSGNCNVGKCRAPLACDPPPLPTDLSVSGVGACSVWVKPCAPSWWPTGSRWA
jgi:hypothetical protein